MNGETNAVDESSTEGHFAVGELYLFYYILAEYYKKKLRKEMNGNEA